jgi:hypothetical protein
MTLPNATVTSNLLRCTFHVRRLAPLEGTVILFHPQYAFIGTGIRNLQMFGLKVKVAETALRASQPSVSYSDASVGVEKLCNPVRKRNSEGLQLPRLREQVPWA